MAFSHHPWTRVAAWSSTTPGPTVLLPLGAIEAHGPHLPLDTDTRIAVCLAERVRGALVREGSEAVVAPPITATAAEYAASFPGTISVDPATETRLIVETVEAFRRMGAGRVVLVNLHFDPVHMGAVKAAVAAAEGRWTKFVVFPNFTRRRHAEAIGGEFATGACHGGEFETSLMLVAAPDLVGEHKGLPALEVDLAEAIRAGKKSFRDLGLDEAYCGHPATASVNEGERLLDVLVRIVLGECADHR